MTLLPVVERELRVAARRPSTYWTRGLAAVGMMGVWLLLFLANRGASAAEVNRTLFIALGVLALGFCLLAGIFLTADCLSEEKREGTLGLLFLTDLRGYDVVLGKLIATSVHAAYGLLAMLPVLALPLLMGGVTVGEFWRVALALSVTLFLSLNMGMCVSAAVREAREAMAGTLLGMLLLAGALPAVGLLVTGLAKVRLPYALIWPSPVHTFIAALDMNYRLGPGPREFWGSLYTVSGLGIGLLVVASLLLPRAWQDGPRSVPADGATTKPEHEGLAKSGRRSARTQLLLDGNPYLWLASRRRSSDFLAGVLVGLLLLLWFCALIISLVVNLNRSARWAFMLCLFTSYGLHQAGKYLAALDATRQLSEDRRSGALELLLVTPLGEARILSGQKRALKRRSLGLKFLLLLVNGAMCWMVWACRRQLHMGPADRALFGELFLGSTVVLFTDIAALHTVGTWMAIRARGHQRAVLGTLGRVMLVPWAAIFLWVFLMMTRAFSPGASEVALIFALWFMLGIATDLVSVARARAGLGRGLRYWLTCGTQASDRECSGVARPSTASASHA
jgi:hypothetical protein